jgi:hypothetical protein
MTGTTYGTATGLGKDVLKVNLTVEGEGTVFIDVEIVKLVVTGRVEDGNLL